MKFTTSLLALLPALSVALALPVASTPVTPEADTVTAVDDAPLSERQWPPRWNIVGQYPDGRYKCRPNSAHPGFQVYPCQPPPPAWVDERLMHEERCRRYCCDPDGKPCRFPLNKSDYPDFPKLPPGPDWEIVIRREEWCRNNCCDPDGEPCRFPPRPLPHTGNTR